MNPKNNCVNLNALTTKIGGFINKRDWAKFHTPKNLATSISIESNELLEIFQWDNPSFSELIEDDRRLTAISMEIADIQIYLLELMGKLGVNLEEIVEAKIQLNENKYPVDKYK